LSGLVREAYDELRGKRKALDLETFREWEEIRELLETCVHAPCPVLIEMLTGVTCCATQGCVEGKLFGEDPAESRCSKDRRTHF
jgi:hypothetical protein